MEKKYESKKTYGEKYNKLNINVQLKRDVIDNLKEYLSDNNIDSTLKAYIEKLILSDIKKTSF